MILFESDGENMGKSIRIGYLLAEAAWGQGFASELLEGFVKWCRTVEISLVIGGVARSNVPSQRVMERNGFTIMASSHDQEDLRYELRLE